jgi:hypothetical protein
MYNGGVGGGRITDMGRLDNASGWAKKQSPNAKGSKYVARNGMETSGTGRRDLVVPVGDVCQKKKHTC